MPRVLRNQKVLETYKPPIRKVSKSSKFAVTPTFSFELPKQSKQVAEEKNYVEDVEKSEEEEEEHTTADSDPTMVMDSDMSSQSDKPQWAGVDFSAVDRSFQVDEINYNELQEWIQQHPVALMEITRTEMKNWISIFHEGSNRNLYFPPSFNVGNLTYVFMPEFPGSSKKHAFMGAIGIVCAYQCVQNFSVVVVKTSVSEDENDSLEQESYEILNFLNSTGRMNSNSLCGSHFINLTAGTVVNITNPPEAGAAAAADSFKQSFVVIEKMDTDLLRLRKSHPKLFKDINALRFIFRCLAEGLACMHLASPKPVAHGDFKPANVLCSPYTDQWINLILKHDKALTKSHFIYVKLADFDVSFTRVWDTKKVPQHLLTPAYSSPQRLGNLKIHQNKATPQDDIWALGMIMLWCSTFQNLSDKLFEYIGAVMSRDQYFSEATSHELLEKAVAEIIRLAKLDWRRNWKVKSAVKNQTSDELADLISKCLCVDESERITIDQVLQHPFLSDLETKYNKRI